MEFVPDSSSGKSFTNQALHAFVRLSLKKHQESASRRDSPCLFLDDETFAYAKKLYLYFSQLNSVARPKGIKSSLKN